MPKHFEEPTDEEIAAMVSKVGNDDPFTSLPTLLPNYQLGNKVKEEVSREVKSKTGPPAKYPWELWTDGAYHAVDPIAFGIATYALQLRLHNRAKLHGLVLKTETKGLDGLIGFQFFRTVEERDAKWDVEYDDGYGDKGPED